MVDLAQNKLEDTDIGVLSPVIRGKFCVFAGLNNETRLELSDKLQFPGDFYSGFSRTYGSNYSFLALFLLHSRTRLCDFFGI